MLLAAIGLYLLIYNGRSPLRIAAKLLSEALRNKSKEDVSISRRPNIEEREAFRDAGPPTACSNRAVSFDLYSVDSIKTPCIHTSNMIISLR